MVFSDAPEPEPWTPFVRAQHEIAVWIPGILLSVPEGERQALADYLVWSAMEAQKDPEATAFSIG